MGKEFSTGVLTISDKGSQGKRVDESGKTAVSLLQGAGFSVVQTRIVPDDRQQIARTLNEWVDKDCLSLIVTSGGTGLSPSDVTPQAMKDVIEFEVPGMAEAMRAESLKKTPHAMISRAIDHQSPGKSRRSQRQSIRCSACFETCHREAGGRYIRLCCSYLAG
jgi:molybdopterin adenylyltransferase